jgi:hypothetical protein
MLISFALPINAVKPYAMLRIWSSISSNTIENLPIIPIMRPEGLPKRFGEPLPSKPVRETGRVFFYAVRSPTVGIFYVPMAISFKNCPIIQSLLTGRV